MNATSNRRAARRGTVMLEMIVAVVIFAAMITLIFFFGWAMTNQQNIRASDRYLAWENVYGGSRSTGDINAAFLSNSATNVALDYGGGQGQTLADYVSMTTGSDSSLSSLVSQVTAAAPQGQVDAISAEFPSDVGLWQYFQGAIHDSSGREGVEWRHSQFEENGVMTNLYLQDIQNGVAGIGNSMGTMIQNLYLGGW